MKIKVNVNSISQFLFCVGVIVKQFYLLPSGSMQIGDICLVASFFFVIRKVSISKFGNNKDDLFLLLYIILIFIIDVLYSVYYFSTSFIVSALYYLFNFLIVLSFRENSRDKCFLKRLQIALKLSIIMQTLFYITGIGRVYAGVRYMGTFNDPNQFGFYVFSAVLLIYVISVVLNQKRPYLWIVLMLWLVLQSASTGMAVGTLVFIVALIFFELLQKNKNYAVLFVGLVIVILLLIVVIQSVKIKLPSIISDSFMYERFVEKINKILQGDDALDGISSDRGWFLLKDYWYMMIYGAGEANIGRFSGWGGEVHSSIFGPLFYYGIIPFCIWMKWCFVQFKRLNRMLICVYIGLLFESITLVNTRQPFFWILLAIAGMSSVKKKGEYANE